MLHQVVAGASFGANGDPGLFERPNIAVNCPQTNIEPVGQFGSPHNSLALQVDQDGIESFKSVHEVQE